MRLTLDLLCKEGLSVGQREAESNIDNQVEFLKLIGTLFLAHHAYIQNHIFRRMLCQQF